MSVPSGKRPPGVERNSPDAFRSLKEVVESVLVRDRLLGGADEEEDEEVEAAKFWVALHKSGSASGTGDAGKLLLSMQLVPEELIPTLPAGKGRSAPNTNPALPKPTVRPRSSSLQCSKVLFAPTH
eukprot:2043132-Prymnesium_polylepis.1